MARPKDYKFSEETKQKMSLSHKGKKHTEQQKIKIGESHKGKPGGMLGKKHSKKTLLKMVESHKGERAWNYIKDRTKLKKDEKKWLDGQYRDWMKKVKNRDGWKCRLKNNECSGRLEAHHIFTWRDYKELRYIISNGITLCAKHHPRKHKDEITMIPIFQELLVNTIDLQ